ncbi:hypothetical protein CTI12_AA505600 [Artemisia annua]|uniref:Uncharacterized protein n=1 Tax=Artemisia annua TaxID=35608 RepID=A0A2U1LCJ4_ARTAN|nr:hypothetical protein CTI12_AA505600 [Artemisia annua]
MVDRKLYDIKWRKDRYGHPPSYTHLKIPGPIPPGASFGYHPGGWGKPPVDEVDYSVANHIPYNCLEQLNSWLAAFEKNFKVKLINDAILDLYPYNYDQEDTTKEEQLAIENILAILRNLTSKQTLRLSLETLYCFGL